VVNAVVTARLQKHARIGKLLNMPELPDIAAYISALEPRIVNQPIQGIRLSSLFLLRSVQPSLRDVEGRTVRELRRIGKRIAIGARQVQSWQDAIAWPPSIFPTALLC
jgi:hypothetical protein